MVPITFEELKDKLRREDEVTLLELLEVYSDDIIERFEDYIENKFVILEEYYNREELEDE